MKIPFKITTHNRIHYPDIVQRIIAEQMEQPNYERQPIVKANRTLGTPSLKLTLTLFISGMLFCATADAAKQAGKHTPFATVDDVTITWQEYRNAYVSESNTKFYHAKPTEDQLAAFEREVANKLVANALLVKEAKRRNLKPDSAAVEQGLQKYEQRFATDPNWPKARNRVLPIITKRLQNENLVSQLEELVRNVPPPNTKQQRQYYDAHPDKFTSPPQPRVSVILLRVDPGGSEDDWNKAMEEGEGLVKRIRAGEDFAALARDYSGDSSAEEGGDMGYLHAGMLPGLPEETVAKLKPGETADPIKLLEGVAIFRLVDRIQPAPSSFEASQQRVSELWLKEQSDLAWNSLIAKLKKKAKIHVDESRFIPLPAAGGKSTKNDSSAATEKK
jgi:parvulin-like peptidyl-prolyl isomerase